jgi:hypothetical protein
MLTKMLRNLSYVSYLSLIDDDIDYINNTDYYSAEIFLAKNYSKNDASGVHHHYKSVHWFNLFLVLSKFSSFIFQI